jgi:hypothetical protein
MAAKKKTPPDAIALLTADHKQVKTWFERFEKSRSDKVKQQLATDICRALTDIRKSSPADAQMFERKSELMANS